MDMHSLTAITGALRVVAGVPGIFERMPLLRAKDNAVRYMMCLYWINGRAISTTRHRESVFFHEISSTMTLHRLIQLINFVLPTVG